MTDDPGPEIPPVPEDPTVESAVPDVAATEASVAASAAIASASIPPTPPAVVPPAAAVAPVGWAPPPAATADDFGSGSSGYPINVRFDRDQRISRAWAIPFLGWGVRWILLIPHFIVLGIYGFVVALSLLVVWIPVLLTGRFPGWGYDLIGGFYRWYIRVGAWLLLMVGPYPPFSTAPGYPVEVDFDRSTRLNNLWGIPIVGIYLRAFLAIPHLIVLAIFAMVMYLVILVAWIPVLINGRYPQLGYDIVGGFFRWWMRVGGWVILMAGPYPPFRLGE